MIPKIFRFAAMACLAAAPFSGAQAQTSRTYVIAETGDRTPNRRDRIDFPGSFALANSGAVFTAHLQRANALALFSTTLGEAAEILRIGTIVAGAGEVTGITGNLATNEQAEALLYATTTDRRGKVHDTLITGRTRASVKATVVAGWTVPDGNGVFYSFGGESINDAGEVGFWGSIDDGIDPIITTNGLFIGHQDGTITEITRSGQPAPGETNLFYSMGFPGVINPAGQVCFGATIRDSHFGTGYSGGLYRATSAADMVKIVRAYEPAPDTGYLFGSLYTPALNDAGVACFFASFIDDAGTFKGVGFFKSDGSDAGSAIAYTGEDAPDNLGQYTAFDNTAGINHAGQSAYVGYYQGDTTGSGVFLGDGLTQRALVLSGQTAPGGSTFTGFGPARINDSGTVAFGAMLDGSPFVNGVFLTDGIETIKVAQVGDVVNGIEIAQIGFDPKAFNNLGQFAYEAIDPTGANIRFLLFAPAGKLADQWQRQLK